MTGDDVAPKTKRGRPTGVGSGKPNPQVNITKRIGAYLDECRMNVDRVGLGRLEGLPPSTADPAVVEKAIGILEESLASASTTITELRLRARLFELNQALTGLRSADGENEKLFIKHGAAYATKNKIPYEVWRDMGVSAAVLKAAGITFR